MLKRKNILNFFLEQQKKLTHLQMNECPLHDKKKLTDNYFLRNKLRLHFDHKMEQKREQSILTNQNNLSSLLIPHYILDQDFCNLFQTKYKNHENIQKEDIYCLFTSPLHEEWLETISIKYEDSMILRTGFFNEEYEIYDSILHGFDGMFIYCQGLDKYKIQYLTETAREYHFTLIFIIHNKNELQTLLETDAPYLAISGFKAHNFELDTSVFFQLSNLIPKTANLMAWAGKLENDKKMLLNNIGYKVIFEVC
jgi:Indole-3-glycerol phosphate synthase